MAARNRKGNAGARRAPARAEAPSRLARLASIGEARWFAPALTAAYALTLAVTLFHHELWRDELQAWMFARDSAGVVDLFRNMEYEASPMLWHLLLMPVTRLTSSPVGMQVLHWAIACATIFIVAKYAPFDPLQKILFSFGYFPLYEFGVMSRNYALGLLFIVAMCALLRSRHRNPLPLALVLVLMSHTSAHACIVAIGALFVLALDYWRARRALAEDGAVDTRKILAGFAIAAAGILLAVLHMHPPADVTQSGGNMTWVHSWFLGWNGAWLENCLRAIPFVVFFPVDPRFLPVVGQIPESPAIVYGAAMALALVAAAAAFLWRNPLRMILFLGLVTGFFLFFYMVHFGSFRHHAFFLVALLVAVWGGRYFSGERRGGTGAARLGSVLLTVLLAMHAFGGARAVAIEIERPFSQAARAAEYIRANGLESLPMLGFPDWSASAVVGHLSPDKRIHYAQGDRLGSFVIYDGARLGEGARGAMTADILLSRARALAARNDGKALLISAASLEIPPDLPWLRPLAAFTGAIAADENFWLYLYEEPAPGAAPAGR